MAKQTAQQYERDLLKTLRRRVLEERRFIQVVAGPRQIGKTTLLQQLVAENLIFSKYYSLDAVTGADGAWLDMVWENMRIAMRDQGETEGLLILDEIQKISNWSEYVKKNWDEDTRSGIKLKIILSGSSRLLLQQGLGESLMGRFELNYLGHWSYREMHTAFGLTPEQYVWFGGYPGAAALIHDEPRFKDYVLNAIIESSISKDVLSLTRINKPALLRNLFEFAAVYSSQILSYTKMLGQLSETGNTTTLSFYLQLLDQAGLAAGLDVYSPKLVKTRAASPKLQVHNTALIAAEQQTMLFNDVLNDPVYWGRLVESAVGAHLLGEISKKRSVKLYYWRDGNVEIDFVLKSGEAVIGIEVKSKIAERAPHNLQVFQERFPGARTILVGGDGLTWQKFLTMSIEQIFDKNHSTDPNPVS
jgi:predicted AAA+ superfamily ATPase